MLNPPDFLSQYKRYFGPNAPLPIVISFTDTPLGNVQSTHGCMFKLFHTVQNGEDISLGEKNINCMGGKVYSGFSSAPSQMFNFVANKEKYKISTECAADAVNNMNLLPASANFLNLIRLDRLNDFAGCIGLLFLVTPDILSGLFMWANYDHSDINSVKVPWGSGCSQTISALMSENDKKGEHCFIGMLDISARPYFKADILSFSIPMSRFEKMSCTLAECFAAGSPAWNKLRQRIDSQSG